MIGKQRYGHKVASLETLEVDGARRVVRDDLRDHSALHGIPELLTNLL